MPQSKAHASKQGSNAELVPFAMPMPQSKAAALGLMRVRGVRWPQLARRAKLESEFGYDPHRQSEFGSRHMDLG